MIIIQYQNQLQRITDVVKHDKHKWFSVRSNTYDEYIFSQNKKIENKPEQLKKKEDKWMGMRRKSIGPTS